MRTLAAVLALAFLAAGCGPSEEAPAGPEADPAATTTGEPPRLVSITADGLQEEIRALDADAVVLNVWATWCGPCRVEFPEFVRYSRDKAGEGVAVRFLSVDESGDLARVQQFLVEHGVSGRTYLTAEGTDIVAALAAPNRWAYGIPVTLIYGPDGELRDFWEGTVNYDFLDAKVQRVLAAAGETAAAG
ncbi:MAG TPA: TlpA disulfide reductase family protein [Rubricoccaceae bacterium]|nr:TlpA disulfide reductase family protein [Rubricoccaceae bacterium]